MSNDEIEGGIEVRAKSRTVIIGTLVEDGAHNGIK